ncbi:phosphatidylserine decarboxylase [Mycena belliarum]|uniref:Phosphatidylserine decarboxylase n=1 Tax=Mycena belliarum TaxID=1033014 RepID=A0AAD6UFG5_9AGAR|nr:phosphatidylserine decarboxylase [Mycena belliae]
MDHSHKLVEHFRNAGWLPVSDEAHDEWIGGMAREVVHPEHRATFPVLPEIKEFKRFIESTPEVYMGFHRMFNEKESFLSKHVPHYDRVLEILNKILQEPPAYGGIGAPVYMLLAHAMNNQGGFSTFALKDLNTHFKRMFDKWAIFFSSPDSCSVLHTGEGGWFSKPALAALAENYGELSFEETFVCDPSAKYYGFASWDDFFRRCLRPNVRPIEHADNPNTIGAACESQLYKIAKGVQEMDTFWLKGEPYSLRHMLNNDEFVPQFLGGTVFQGFLQVHGYHRWHAPVAGTIKKIEVVPGAYFCQSPATLHQPNESSPYIHCLAFLSAVNTRMLLFLEADNPRIGLVCVMMIGMAEVSTAEATVAVGQHVERGDELGMFHFGGSTHVLVFRKEAEIEFFDGSNKLGDMIEVRSAIGCVQPK